MDEMHNTKPLNTPEQLKVAEQMLERIRHNIRTGTLPKRRNDTPEQHQAKEAAFRRKIAEGKLLPSPGPGLDHLPIDEKLEIFFFKDRLLKEALAKGKVDFAREVMEAVLRLLEQEKGLRPSSFLRKLPKLAP